jgi:GGDEF-like domain/PucR C-terminal helix-turn-helix domain
MPRAQGAGHSAEIGKIAEELAKPGGVENELVARYLETLLVMVAQRRPASQVEIDLFRSLGATAAGHAIAAAHVIRLLSAGTSALWPKLPDMLAGLRAYPHSRADAIGLGALVWETASTAISAVIAGHEGAQRDALLTGQGPDQMFLAGLLSGTADVGHLLDLAEQAGFHLAVPHFVTVVEAEGGLAVGDRLLRSLETAIRVRLGHGDALAGAYRGDLVVVAAAATEAFEQVADALREVRDGAGSTGGRRWRAGIGRAWDGLRGVGLSYHDAREALHFARQLGSDEPVVQPGRLLLYRVLLRDRRAMADLVRSVLGPLRDAHQGAEPLLETLEEYFAAGGVLTDAARALHLSVRAVSYRLDRIRLLTGHDINVPIDRLALQLAVMGARLLDWPGRSLADLD